MNEEKKRKGGGRGLSKDDKNMKYIHKDSVSVCDPST